MTKSYTEKDIELLTDHQHVQRRPAMYIGNMSPTEYDIPLFINDEFKITPITFAPSKLKCLSEIVDNCTDEFSQLNCPKGFTITLDIHPILGLYSISDTGRGVPLGKHKSGKYTPEVVFGSLKSGRNFGDNKVIGTIGMNGLGASAVCAVSSEFSVDIHRDGKRYQQTFTNGAKKVTKPAIEKSQQQSGTSVQFQLDPTIFSNDITLPPELLENKAMETALTNPGISVVYNNKKYKFKNGFDDIIKKISTNYHKFTIDNIDFYVVFDIHQGLDESIFSWVNSSLLFDGGLCNTQFTNAFFDAVITQLKPKASKLKSTVTKNDIKQDLLIFGNLKLSDPEYDAQSKTRLTGPNLRKEMSQLLQSNWSTFTRKHQNWLDDVLNRAVYRHHNNANIDALTNHKKNKKRKIDGLVDATSTNRFECQLIVTEGLSAAGMITDVRNSKTTAALPLRGKINNTHGITIAQLLKLQKVADLITAIGLVPGRNPIRSELHYGKLIIATDADVDGADIFTLLVNMLYQFWPKLFDPEYDPFVYRLLAPNVSISKGKQRKHFITLSDFEKQKHKYTNWSVEYFKGLGSMSRIDWNMILSGKTDTLIPIVDDGHMVSVLELLFSPNADNRKTWLQGN